MGGDSRLTCLILTQPQAAFWDTWDVWRGGFWPGLKGPVPKRLKAAIVGGKALGEKGSLQGPHPSPEARLRGLGYIWGGGISQWLFRRCWDLGSENNTISQWAPTWPLS